VEIPFVGLEYAGLPLYRLYHESSDVLVLQSLLQGI
jgi:hypothetical protein